MGMENRDGTVSSLDSCPGPRLFLLLLLLLLFPSVASGKCHPTGSKVLEKVHSTFTGSSGMVQCVEPCEKHSTDNINFKIKAGNSSLV